MSALDLERVIATLREFTQKTKAPLELILVGGLAMTVYGMDHRATRDIDGEVRGNIKRLHAFLKQKKIPAGRLIRWRVARGVCSKVPRHVPV